MSSFWSMGGRMDAAFPSRILFQIYILWGGDAFFSKLLINASIVLKVGSLAWCAVFNPLCHFILSWRRALSYRNQSNDLQSKSMDWFLYDNNLRHERANLQRRDDISKIIIWSNYMQCNFTTSYNTDQKYLCIWTVFAQCNNNSFSPTPR